MFRNMVTSLLKNNQIKTTDAKAKELRRWADKVITLAKRGDLHARRQVLAIVREKNVVHKLFAEANERFGHLAGGYTRVIKAGFRPGDAARVSIIQFVVSEVATKPAEVKESSSDSETTISKDKSSETSTENTDQEQVETDEQKSSLEK